MEKRENPYEPPGQGHATADHAEIGQRIASLNRMSFAFGIPGMILQGVGNVKGAREGDPIGLLTLLLGTALLIVGLSYYARSRGHHPAFGAFGLLSCVGLIVLALLPKNCLACGARSQKGHCSRCGAPIAQ